MLDSIRINNSHTQKNVLIEYDDFLLHASYNTKRFIKILKFIVFLLLFQNIFYKRNNELEIEEEIPQIEINILPTFLVNREKLK